MILLVVPVLCLGLGLLTGGRLGRLATHKLRGESVLLVCLALQVLLPLLAGGAEGLLRRSLLVTWLGIGAAAAAVALVNSRTAGMALVAAGLLLNLLVVAVNGGMPVSISNLAHLMNVELAISKVAVSWLHVALDEASRLVVLADTIPVWTGSRPWALISFGDILLSLGAGYFVFCGMHRSSDQDAG